MKAPTAGVSISTSGSNTHDVPNPEVRASAKRRIQIRTMPPPWLRAPPVPNERILSRRINPRCPTYAANRTGLPVKIATLGGVTEEEIAEQRREQPCEGS